MVGTLEVSTWQGISIGAVHWYAKLYWEIDNKLQTLELTRKLTAKEARAMSAEAKEQGYLSRMYRAGEDTEGFNTEPEAIDAGVKYFKENFKGVLYLGQYACCSAWKRVVHWPEEHGDIVKKMNSISDEFIALNGYEGPEEKVVEKLDSQWFKLYDKLNKLCK